MSTPSARRPAIRPTVPAAILLGLFAVLAIVVAVDVPAFSAGVRELSFVAATSRTDAATVFFKIITFLASGPFMVVAVPLATLALVALKRPVDAWFVGLPTAFSWAMVQLFKVILQVPRPAGGAAIDIPSTMAFPSAHAAAALIFYGTIVLVLSAELLAQDDTGLPEDADEFTRSMTVPLWKGVLALVIQLVAVILVVLIGVSRVYLGVHWVTDVIGGWLLAAAILAATSRTWSEMRRRQRAPE